MANADASYIIDTPSDLLWYNISVNGISLPYFDEAYDRFGSRRLAMQFLVHGISHIVRTIGICGIAVQPLMVDVLNALKANPCMSWPSMSKYPNDDPERVWEAALMSHKINRFIIQ